MFLFGGAVGITAFEGKVGLPGQFSCYDDALRSGYHYSTSFLPVVAYSLNIVVGKHSFLFFFG
jgi:hypothetical protein